MATPPLLDTVLSVHGGRTHWMLVDRIEGALSSGGLAFALHGQAHALRGLRVVVWPHAVRVELRDYVRPGWTGVWTRQHVALHDERGTVQRERLQPRASFERWSRQVHWDALDMLYFAGYALWNYLSFPFVLAQPGVTVTVAPVRPGGAATVRLDARFDPDIPTHSPQQRFWLDAQGYLLRHDYTADVIGRLATAAHLCQAAESVSGLRFYTRRRVVPRFGQRLVLPGPTLVWIELDALRVIRRSFSVPTP